MKAFKHVLGVILCVFILVVELAVLLPAAFTVWIMLFPVNATIWVMKTCAKLAEEWTDREIEIAVVGFLGLDVER